MTPFVDNFYWNQEMEVVRFRMEMKGCSEVCFPEITSTLLLKLIRTSTIHNLAGP